jgi:ankyrin repeat protein
MGNGIADPCREKKWHWKTLHFSHLRLKSAPGMYLINDGDHCPCYFFSGQTALHLASFYGHEEVVVELLNFGANVNTADSSGYTSLHVRQKQKKSHFYNICIYVQ